MSKGVPTIGTRIKGDALAEWNELVESYVSKGYSRVDAVCKANKANPQLRERVVSEANQGRE